MRPITIPLVQETVETPKELVQESVIKSPTSDIGYSKESVIKSPTSDIGYSKTSVLPKDEPLREPTKEFQPAQGEVFDIFPTPMFRGYMDLDHEQVSQDVRDMVSKVKEIHGDDEERNYTTYFDHDIRTSMHQLEWYTTFSNLLKDTYIQFIHSEFGRKVNTISRHDIHLFAWVNRYEGEHSHETHNHINSTMSGTYYPLVNEGSSPIKFHNPNSLQAFAHVESCATSEDDTGVVTTGSVDVHIKPRLGEFLMWPSYMMHQVSKSGQPNYERISISFNLSHNEPLEETESGDQLSYGFMHD